MHASHTAVRGPDAGQRRTRARRSHELEADGFVLGSRLTVAATPAEAYRALGEVQHW